MEKLKELYEEIWEELEGAEKYAKQALAYKDKNPALAKMFHDMSQQEMNHADTIASEAEKIAAGSDSGKAIHDFFKQMHTSRSGKIKAQHSQYR